MANQLGDKDYGRFATVVVYSGLISVLADLGLSTLYTREAAREPDRLADFLSTVATGKLALSGLAAVVMAVAMAVVGLPELALAGAALLFLSGYSNLLR